MDTGADFCAVQLVDFEVAMRSRAMQLKGRNVLVVGLARSGAAAAEFLLGKGAQVHVTDALPEKDLRGAVERLRQVSAALKTALGLTLGGHDDADFERADLVVLSPGVPLSLPPLARARARGVPVIAEVELAFRFLKGRVVGVTGSNGKTTTTTLLGELFRTAGKPYTVAGNIGSPLISVVSRSRDEDTHVVELSSFQLETIDSFRPDVAVLLNVTPDHLDRYADMDAYFGAKKRIFVNQQPTDYALLNQDDSFCGRLRGHLRANEYFFSRLTRPDRGVHVEAGELVFESESRSEAIMKVEEISLKGSHNVENVMAALCAGRLCGLERESMRRAVREFRGVEHRLEFVATIGGVDFFNDSKATNVDSALKALEAFPTSLIPILGGKDKGSDYRPLRPYLESRCRAAILIGAAADKIQAAVEGTTTLHRARDMREAVELGLLHAQPGDTVLLAPACASFDMFENYEHRGRMFKQEVQRLAGDSERRKS